MGKYDGILLAVDFDGTFALDGARLSVPNCEAVSRFQRGGGRFTIASGRSPQFVVNFDGFKCNAPLIMADGTMICNPHTGEILRSFTLPGYTMGILDELAQLPIIDSMYLCDSNGQGNKWQKESGCAPSAFFSAYPKPWYKVLCAQGEAETLALREHIHKDYPGMFSISRSYPKGLEIHAPGTGKGECLRYLKEICGDITRTIGAGDYENDVSLIRMSDVGYAVANAVPEAKIAADRITVSNNEHAVARIIDDII